MGSLAYRSNKLGFKSSKLAYSNPWVALTRTVPQYKLGSYDWLSNGYGFNAQTNNYMMGWDGNGQFSVIDRALANFDTASWVAGDPVARLSAAHSHGLDTPYSMRSENYFLYEEGLAVFTKPAGLSTITEARLWIGNAGEIFHTIQARGTYVWVNMYDGLFTNDCGYPENWLPYLNNTWLEIVISASDTVYHTIQLSRGDLATLNYQQGNGKTAAGLGQYSYMYASSIYLNMPVQVISMLNTYGAVAVDIYWNWDDAVLGPACLTCLHLAYCRSMGYPHPVNQIGYAEIRDGCSSPWGTRTALARLGNFEAR